MDISKYLQNLPDSVSTWHLSKNNELTATFPGGQQVVIDDEKLASYHPDLPASLRANIRWSNIVGSPNVHKTLVKATLMYLGHGGVELAGLSGRTYVYNSIFDVVDNFEENATLIKGSVVEVRFEEVDSRKIPFITATALANVDISNAFLDDKFPGWKERWVVGRELGLTFDATLPYLFQKDMSIPGESLEINFD